MSTEQMNGEAMKVCVHYPLGCPECEAARIRQARSGVPSEGPREHPLPPLTGSVGPQSPHQINLKSPFEEWATEFGLKSDTVEWRTASMAWHRGYTACLAERMKQGI